MRRFDSPFGWVLTAIAVAAYVIYTNEVDLQTRLLRAGLFSLLFGVLIWRTVRKTDR